MYLVCVTLNMLLLSLCGILVWCTNLPESSTIAVWPLHLLPLGKE